MLNGKNVSLRPATPDDAELMAGWFSDTDYLGEFYNVWPETKLEWERDLAKEEDPRETGMYLIVRKDTGEPAGTIGYFNPFTLKMFARGLELYYQVHPAARGQGVATQAVCLLVNHLFDATPVERLQATVVVGNEASCRVAEGAGMQNDGLYRRVFFLHGSYVDLRLYSIVREDWHDEKAYRQARRPF